jgi:CheY-like chemotaxis protein/anti-sigma regulatory factor (Ser/Thr protein kinase)
LVDDLLDVTRVTTGKIVLRPVRIELSSLVSQTIDTLSATGRMEGHVVTFDGQPAWVDGDATRLEQVVTNLVTNAVKYTPAGGTIRVSVGSKEGVATIQVADTGIGIAADLLPRIFDLFTQGRRGLDRSQGGLGIGLTIVKRLVELHGGRVDATSHPGRGSAFTIRLPAALPMQEVAAPVVEVDQRRRRRVLVVEDQPYVREALCLALNTFGHTTFEAPDGFQAIEVASRTEPEVAIIDIGLPGQDGYQVARQLRRAPGGDAMYLIALTGYGQPEDQRLAEEAGFDLHIVKPVDPERLSALVADASRASA